MFRFLNCLTLVLLLWCGSCVALADTADCQKRFPAIYAIHAKSWCADYGKCQGKSWETKQIQCCRSVFKSVEADLVWISSLCKFDPLNPSCRKYPPQILNQVDQANQAALRNCQLGSDD